MFTCNSSSDPLPGCIATCTRWSSINEGQPLRIYIDEDSWDPTHYNGQGPFIGSAVLDEPLARTYAVQALEIWQQAYPCGTLYELVDTPAEAEVIVQYPVTTPETEGLAGNAQCFCDADDDVCVNQFDHSNFWEPGNQAIMNIFLRLSGGSASVNAFINLHAHEFGHILGMGHVRNQDPPVTSVMGNPLNLNADLVLYDFDREQIEARYPCNCTLVTPLRNRFLALTEPRPTSDFCPGCQVDGLG